MECLYFLLFIVAIMLFTWISWIVPRLPEQIKVWKIKNEIKQLSDKPQDTSAIVEETIHPLKEIDPKHEPNGLNSKESIILGETLSQQSYKTHRQSTETAVTEKPIYAPRMPEKPAPPLSAINKTSLQYRSLKKDYYLFEEIIRRFGIKYLYHFTDWSNIRSIKRFDGLYSWKSSQMNGISVSKPGGDHLSRELDSRKNLEDYVRLAFNANQPMMHVAQKEGRIEYPVILKVDSIVILWNTTLFSDINAAANMASVGGTIENFRRINFQIACGSSWTSEEQKGLFQAEVLVKSHIPLKYISIL
jgi:hypothetical protein